MIQLKNAVKIYGQGTAQTRALNGVNFQVARGEFVAVMGPSGSGKIDIASYHWMSGWSYGRFVFVGWTGIVRKKGKRVAQVSQEVYQLCFSGFCVDGRLYDTREY